MPMPLGHITFGLACYAAFAPEPHRQRADGKNLAILATIIVASQIPDIDLITLLWKTLDKADSFRHTFTHGILFSFLVACICWVTLTAREGPKSLFAWFMVTYGHCLLDIFNHDLRLAHGVQLLSPFTNQRFYWPVIPNQGVKTLGDIFVDPRIWGYLFMEAFIGIAILILVWMIRNLMVKPRPYCGIKITPHRLVALRLFNLTLGSFPQGSALVRQVIGKTLINKKEGKDTYCQSARFFTYDQLDKDSESGPGGAT